MDIFISLYNIHRDGRFWPEPDLFDPDRFTRPYSNPDVPEWKGYDPAKWENNLYPNEVASDFAYLPFGGGARKCVGDEFATLEATVTLAMVLRRFDFDFDLIYFDLVSIRCSIDRFRFFDSIPHDPDKSGALSPITQHINNMQKLYIRTGNGYVSEPDVNGFVVN